MDPDPEPLTAGVSQLHTSFFPGELPPPGLGLLSAGKRDREDMELVPDYASAEPALGGALGIHSGTQPTQPQETAVGLSQTLAPLMAMVQQALQSNVGPVLEQVLAGQEVVSPGLSVWRGSNIIVPLCLRLWWNQWFNNCSP